jgi:cob(I)alamin adenosyltransferase
MNLSMTAQEIARLGCADHHDCCAQLHRYGGDFARRAPPPKTLRRAERLMVALAAEEPVGAPALKYANRLSEFLFVASRHVKKAEGQGGGDVLWVPGKNS